MLFITVLMLELNDMLHPNVLRRLIRLPDPKRHMLSILLKESTTMHLRRMLVSSFVYFSCIFLLLYVPIRGTQEVFTRYYNSTLTLKWYTYYPAIELQLPIEVTLYYLLSIQTIDGLKGPLRFLLHSLLTKSCALLGLSAYMLPRTKIQTDGDNVRPQDQEQQRQRRQQREERRNRARQELRRRRYVMFEREAREF